MKILLFMLVVFSQAFALVITSSNICQNFSINSVEGVGCIAVPEKFKESLKSKLLSESAHGINIKEDFFEYMMKKGMFYMTCLLRNFLLH